MAAHSPRHWFAGRLPMMTAMLVLASTTGLFGAEPTAKSASTGPESKEAPTLKIRGLGLFDNRRMHRMIRQTYGENQQETPYDANFIEDAFVVLRNQLLLEGYRKAVLRAELTLADGSEISIEWDGEGELNVPRPLAVQKAVFRAEEGPFFHFEELTITGLTAIPPEQATGYFYKTDMLLRLKSNRRYSRSQLDNSINNLRQELINLGYRDATVKATEIEADDETGEVRVTIDVDQGSEYRVADVNVVVMDATGDAVVQSRLVEMDRPWSPNWQQDYTLQLRNEQYSLGHPDARARMNPVRSEERNGVFYEHLEVLVEPGPEVKLGEVRFEGYKKTRLSWLEKKGAVEGPLLDRLEVDAARDRLSRQGIFNYAGVRYEPDSGSTRDVVFELEEGKRIDLSLLAGYGSYDQFFGGIELDQNNLWGVGHTARFRGMLSTKTANATYTYGIPEFLAPNLGLYANADGLYREELTFDREEIKTAIGVRKTFPESRIQLGLRYSYQFLKTQDSPDAITNDGFTRVSAFILDGQLDRRDNPLAPRKGYRIYGNVEIANPVLGSEAHYEMVQLGAAVHIPLRPGLILHTALQNGIIFSPDPSVDIPFNKRFLPGGENTVRGFKSGGASPYNAQGQQIGAVTFLLWNLELEQYLTERWSVVGFLDGVGISPDLQRYPWDEVLWSAGGGISWNSIIGPVRAEYGYNLNPRSFDPVGTFHLSIGFPF